MSNTRSERNAQYAMQSTQALESSEFTTIFGSNVNSKWFETLMQYATTYLFTFALFFLVLKLGISIYQFVKSSNKTINQQSSLVWNILQTAILSTALVGALAAATVFAVITPALFLVGMGLDALRNTGLFFWNLGKLAALRFQVRNQLNDPNDHLTKLKYEGLKKKYIDKIKQHGIGAVVGTIMSAAITIIFLFPHIGLSAVGATALTVFGAQITVANIMGAATGAALTIPLLPTLYSFGKWIGNKIANGLQNAYSFFKTKLTTQSSNSIIENNERQQPEPALPPRVVINPITSPKRDREYTIDSKVKLIEAINHKLEFNAFNLNSRFRETILDHIDDQTLAKKALKKMVKEKINAITNDLEKGKNSYFGERQRPKREQKLHALLLIKQYFNETEENVFDGFNRYFKNFARIQQNPTEPSLYALIHFIETNLPGVKESYFLDQSDTQNVIEALKVYAYKFPEVVARAELSNA